MPMMIKIKKGLDIKLVGEAEKIISKLKPNSYAIKPTDFIGVFPKMLVKQGDTVKAGSPLFFDKYRDNIQFTSPISGKVTELRRGAKRVLLEIKIEPDEQIVYEDFGKANPADQTREQIIEKLLKSGIWPFIRQRPYSVIANPENDPKAIFISAFDSNPLAPDYDLMVHGKGKVFQTGIDALTKLTSGKIHLNVNGKDTPSDVFTNSKNVQINEFTGPHPAGNIGTQIAHIDPINKGDIVWYLYPQDVITIGNLFFEGKFDTTRLIAFTGSEVSKPTYFKTQLGACIDSMAENNVSDVKKRFISGNVLTGDKVERDGFVGSYHSQVTVIPEGDAHEFFGWLIPNPKKHSFYRSALSWLTPNKKFKLNTNLNGGGRAFVMTGQFEKVFPMNIFPMQLIKSIMIEDIDAMENLGIYEVDEADFALCEYISTSKINIQEIVRNGLNLMRKEMS
ncbi:MAG: Na(+)-translocating NADH-quinone reductase subunit A [Bacteroidetes bacterium]|nr:Na(+)-translocating NADH-quinone reductase subunit A [Bacteroidota bacterium]